MDLTRGKLMSNMGIEFRRGVSGLPGASCPAGVPQPEMPLPSNKSPAPTWRFQRLGSKGAIGKAVGFDLFLSCPKDLQLKGQPFGGMTKYRCQNGKTKRSDPVDSLWTTEISRPQGRCQAESLRMKNLRHAVAPKHLFLRKVSSQPGGPDLRVAKADQS